MKFLSFIIDVGVWVTCLPDHLQLLRYCMCQWYQLITTMVVNIFWRMSLQTEFWCRLEWFLYWLRLYACWIYSVVLGGCIMSWRVKYGLDWTHGCGNGCGCNGQGGGSTVVVVILLCSGGWFEECVFEMSSISRSRSNSRSRSRSPMDRKIRTERYSYRDAPYRRDARRGFRFSVFISFNHCLNICTINCVDN